VLGDRTIVGWSVAAARAASDAVVLVVGEGDEDRDEVRSARADVVVTGGPTRSASVRNGLDAVPSDVGCIVVHDAARPLAPRETWRAVIEPVRTGAADAVICGVPLLDTVKRVSDGVVVETLRREELIAVQTPQAFRAEVLRRAHSGTTDATDDAALVERLGVHVRVVAGDPRNMKITRPDDLVVAEAFVAMGEGTHR
jgi:2-C-methyl-D-erythritol 4-phosphate cytidylyltransferase